MNIIDNSATSATLRLLCSFLLMEESETAAEAYFRANYRSTEQTGKKGTVLRGTRWSFSQALLALALRDHGSYSAIGRIVGMAKQHVRNLYTRLDSHAL